jgi:hypothetical protein
MNKATMTIASLIAGAMMMTACSNAEPVDVSGELTSSESIDSPILVDFFEVDAEDSAAERESVFQVTVDGLGPIAETVEADPELTLIAHALVDDDGDGACTEGEIWGETELTRNEDGTIAEFVVDLKAQPCPAAEAEEEAE